MAKKVLVVEDDSNIAELLRLYLEKDGFDVFLAADGGEGIRRAQELQPDLILLDIMLPVVDGWVVCSEVRKTSNVPIIMLTAKGETFDKISGLEMGADDYVTKPFEVKELMARIHAVMRRSEPEAAPHAAEKRLVFDKLVIDLDSYELIVDGKRVEAPPKEMELLYHLAAFSPATSCSTRCGALSITAIPAPWTSTSSVCAKSWREFRISGRSKRSGASGTSSSRSNKRCTERISGPSPRPRQWSL